MASEQVASLLTGEFCCFIILEGERALAAMHKKHQPEMRSLGRCGAGKQVYHLCDVYCGPGGLKGSFVQPPGELQEEGASPATTPTARPLT